MNKLSHTNAHILVVDDNPLNTKFLEKLLVKKGYRIDTAGNGLEAVEMAQDFIPDLILLDIMMPVMDGYEACIKLKDNPATSEIPIIFITARTATSDIVRGFKLGAVDYVTKPFDFEELLARIQTHLNLKFANEILKNMVVMDGLTKLYNHVHINERLAQEISESQRHQHPLALFMFDLDAFKRINDLYGHKFGDDVLVVIASFLKNNLRKEDVIGRYGGGKFLIILPNTSLQYAYKVAESMRRSIQQLKWQHDRLSLTISGGVAVLEGENTTELIDKTERLLYRAKHNGRNRIEFI